MKSAQQWCQLEVEAADGVRVLQEDVLQQVQPEAGVVLNLFLI
jgi:hypothetical protein